jgi:hypothetical protein
MRSECEYLSLLADKMALVPSRGGALFQNIQNGGRQSLTSTSKPSLQATLAAKVNLDPESGILTAVSSWGHMHRLDGASRPSLKQPDPQGGVSVCMQDSVGLSEGFMLLRYCCSPLLTCWGCDAEQRKGRGPRDLQGLRKGSRLD